MADEQETPPVPKVVCATCLGAGKMINFVLIDGSTRQIWTACPSCNGPHRIVSGP